MKISEVDRNKLAPMMKHYVELKDKYTIIMVTHNMQQAVRVSDNTAFFLLGEVIEYNETEKLLSIRN